MQIIDTIQGSDHWLRLRASRYTASEAAAMMGASKYQSRSELIREKATGATAEVSVQKQAAFDRGHEAEASARPIAEAIVGEELFPVTAVEEIDGLPLLASCDGLTMLGDYGWEHKLYSDDLAQQIDSRNLDPHYVWQLEQQIAVTGAEAILFMASDGTEDRCAHMWYSAGDGLRQQLIAGWKQFDADLKAYEPPEEKPEATGKAPEDLPALRIEVTGEVRDSNLDSFREHALSVIGSINTELQTDEDFADADKTVKWCSEVEKRLEAAKQHALSQTETIDTLFRTIDDIKEQARQKRLELDKLVKARKQAIRDEILRESKYALDDHIKSIERSLESEGLKAGAIDELVSVDFASAMKGKKTVKSLRDAADDVLAKAKIQANEWGERIRANLRRFSELADGYESLFPDKGQLVLKPADDMGAAVKARIAEHEAEQKRREEQRQAQEQRRQEAERERIRQEEQRKAEAQQATHTPEGGGQEAQGAPESAVAAASDAVAGSTEKQDPTADDGQRIKLSDINERIAPLRIDANGLSQLGFESVGRDKAAKLYRASDLPAILEAMVRHIQRAQEAQREAA